jgi:hypothetical protein
LLGKRGPAISWVDLKIEEDEVRAEIVASRNCQPS